MTRVRVRRVYEPPLPEDGQRVLVDRIWPRGLTRADAAIDLWTRDVAPSTGLRQWFGHDPARWEEFARRYREELDAQPELLQPLLAAAARGPVTLVYGARDERHNQAVVLQQVLERALVESPDLAGSPAEPPPAPDRPLPR